MRYAYRFRTPALRNVALSAPYGHNGTYPTLDGIIRQHLDPVAALDAWDQSQAVLAAVPWLVASDFLPMQDQRERNRLRRAVDITPRNLSDGDIAALVAFLNGLTGTASVAGRLGRPARVPSGLEVD